ncbi:hypothetical protein Btru_024652 [Bulinus truncatus]|nr:hypothetical protein Btru_024652 [Bulinus truncatus]
MQHGNIPRRFAMHYYGIITVERYDVGPFGLNIPLILVTIGNKIAMVTTNNLFVSIEEGFIKANKGLSVIFIILIAAINLLLVVKHVRKPNFYYSPKNMIIISLAIGDFLLADFPLIVLAKRYFQTEEDQLSCSLFITYQTYKNYLIHFVYGVGLITLGAELIIRHRLKEVLYRPARAVAASCVPWFLGLVVVLPLCMSGVDYSNCQVWPYNRGMDVHRVVRCTGSSGGVAVVYDSLHRL